MSYSTFMLNCEISKNPDLEFYKKIYDNANINLGCDGGSNNLFKLGLIPDKIIGDMDSIDEDIKKYYEDKNVEFIVFPREKDKTDSQISLEYLKDLGEKNIIMLGANGNRIDHVIGNINLLYDADKIGVNLTILDETSRIFLVKEGTTTIPAKKGETVSFVTISGNVYGIYLNKFKYPLNNFTLEIGDSRMISNVANMDNPSITLKTGSLVCIITKDI